VQQETDQNGQRTKAEYDTNGRVTATRRYANGSDVSEHLYGMVSVYYDSQSFDTSFTQLATGRVAATETGCDNTGVGRVIEMYSYTVAGAVTKKRLRIVRSTGTVDKDVTYGYGADGKPTTVLYPGTTAPYTYTYDSMDRPIKMTGPLTLFGTTTIDLTKDVVYGVAGQVTSMKYMQWAHGGSADLFTETRTYDTLFQLTRQVTTGTSGTAADIGYTYSGSQNNGRILSRTNYQRSGEVVTYQYDSLNRVTSAGSSVGWTQSFDFDEFGNLWSQTMTNGTATPMSVNIDMATNRINSSGWSHDANGNTNEMPTLGGNATLSYDLDNRLSSWTGPGGVEQDGYLADNKRVWKKASSGAETVYFYGAGGQRLITYTVPASPFALISPSENVYFGGRLIRANGISVVHDRLGSVVARGCADCATVTKHDYLPYGEEMGGSTAGNVDKFGTYHRDATTGLDYADQRYFAGLSGRFLTADPAGSGAN